MTLPLTNHAEFEELCAAHAAGELSPGEESRMRQHLAVCADCRLTLEEFDRDVSAIALASANTAAANSAHSVGWKEEALKQRILDQLPLDVPTTKNSSREISAAPIVLPSLRAAAESQHFSSQTLRAALPFAAGFLLAAGLSVPVYWALTHGKAPAPGASPLVASNAQSDAARWHASADDLAKQRDALNLQLTQDRANAANATNNLAALQDRITQQQREIADLRAAGVKSNDEKRQLTAAQERLSASLQDAQFALATTRDQLAAASQQRSGEVLQTADLEKRVSDLSALVKQQGDTIQQQRDLLASDRDIRDLMTARQLYVAEVYDADLNGKPRSPFARVFFTKDKSLIFYGFDLDREPGVKAASTFQAWGRRGPTRTEALNLGILFQDNSGNKKWVLKMDDPEKLQQIDAIFVTVEPKGGSQAPTGKPLLFAYLHVNPNHP